MVTQCAAGVPDSKPNLLTDCSSLSDTCVILVSCNTRTTQMLRPLCGGPGKPVQLAAAVPISWTTEAEYSSSVFSRWCCCSSHWFPLMCTHRGSLILQTTLLLQNPPATTGGLHAFSVTCFKEGLPTGTEPSNPHNFQGPGIWVQTGP